MLEDAAISPKKPSNILHKEVNVNLKSLLITLGKAATNIAFVQLDDLAENGAELLDSLGLETTVDETAGLLIIRSLQRAIQALIKGNRDLFPDEPTNLQDLYQNLENSLADNPFTLNQEFFERPQNLPFLSDAQKGFLDWLMPLIDNPREAESISGRLPEYFADALFVEWKENKSKYLIIIEELDNPFGEAKEKQQAWYHYRVWLQKQIQEPIFWEAFSLKQIYISLRGYCEEKDNGERRGEIDSTSGRRKVFNPVDELERWLEEANSQDAIRLLTGAPGSGKSSFTKMFAARQAEKGRDVLFIPLHRFNLTGNIEESVGEFIQFDGFLTSNPLEKDNEKLSLLIIFDGLDELSKQGKFAAEVARDFVEEVRRLIDSFNYYKTRLQVLISGREVVIQANRSKFAQPHQLIYLLPYFVNEEEKEKHEYIDKHNLLAEDQRQLWWQKYAEAKGKEYTGLPTELNRDNLIDITSQPLLNYLIVLSYDRKRVNFDQDTNLNEIYGDLLIAVYERGYENPKQKQEHLPGHRAIEGITEQQFVTVLMEIALACWHGDGRTTTVKEIEAHCNSSSLKNLLQRFQDSFREDSRASITRLLTAFYFRESGDLRGSEKTFEFSHKSFGEYLTAKRIVLGLSTIHRKLTESETEYADDYDEKKALITWANLCGASPMDRDIFKFVCQEMELKDIETVKEWQKRLCKLIEYLMVRGMPMEALNLPTFKEAMIQSRNAEEALLAVLNACARVTKELSTIDWKSPEAFGEWMARLIGQRKDFEPVFVTECLSYLDLSQCNLRFRDFFRANFEGANLERAILKRANLQGANFERAYLVEANLQGANLERAYLVEANLKRANFERAYLVEANLREAKLQRANLEGANLYWASLQGANLQEANLQAANLQGANLQAAILYWAILKGTIYEDENIDEITK